MNSNQPNLPSRTHRPRVSIVDYGLGNLFSVKQACLHAGLEVVITANAAEILAADAVILPGVAAFGDAMAALRRLDLEAVLHEVVARGTPLVGICLGIQLLMTESEEFGTHTGLGIIPGRVCRFRNPTENGMPLKVPQVQWNAIHIPETLSPGAWDGTLLDGVDDGDFFYFVHSYHIRPEDDSTVIAVSTYGTCRFPSAVRVGNVFAFQFHPERSGPKGLHVYRNLARLLEASDS